MVLLGVICLWFALIVLIVGVVSRASRTPELSPTKLKQPPSSRRVAHSGRRLTTAA